MGAAQTCGRCATDSLLTSAADELQKDEALRTVDSDAPIVRHSNLSRNGSKPRSLRLPLQLPQHEEPDTFERSITVGDLANGRRRSVRSPTGSEGSDVEPPRREDRARTGPAGEGATSSVPRLNKQRFASCPPAGGLSMSSMKFQRCGRAVASGVRLGKLLATGPVDVPPVKCAISVETLNNFNKHAKELLGKDYAKATFRDINAAMIQPSCDSSGKCYARHLNGDAPCSGQVFVCHCWDQHFGEFVESMNQAFRTWPKKPNLWISIFALVQTRRRTPCTRPLDAPFAAALKVSKAILVVQSKQVNIYARLWPLWEMYLASKFGILLKKGGLIVAGPAGGFVGISIDAAEALTSNADDRTAILTAISSEGGFKGVNDVAAKVREGYR